MELYRKPVRFSRVQPDEVLAGTAAAGAELAPLADQGE
jgi:hypothetical protein